MAAGPRSGARNDLTDVAGIAVGHHQRRGRGWCSGTTVVVAPPGTVGSVDVRGGGPATRETDALAPDTLVQHVDAICLSGGSAYGLDAAAGVVDHLASIPRGFRVGPEPEHVVPIVGAAALFDLGVGGRFDARPDAEFGRRAAAAARSRRFAQGNVGAGTGATAGVLKGGVGSASVLVPAPPSRSGDGDAGGDGSRSGAGDRGDDGRSDGRSGVVRGPGSGGPNDAPLAPGDGGDHGWTVAALVVLNPAGSPVDPSSGRLWGADRLLPGEVPGLRPPSRAEAAAHRAMLEAARAPFNTTLVVVATDARLTKVECHRLAIAGHDGLARAIDPIHGYVDGDVVFALATGGSGRPVVGADELPQPTGERLAALSALGAAAADVTARAVVHATLAATGIPGRPSYLEAFPSALRA